MFEAERVEMGRTEFGFVFQPIRNQIVAITKLMTDKKHKMSEIDKIERVLNLNLPVPCNRVWDAVATANGLSN